MSLIQQIKWKIKPPKIGDARLKCVIQNLLKSGQIRNAKTLWWYIFLRWLKLNGCVRAAYRRRRPYQSKYLTRIDRDTLANACRPSDFTNPLPWRVEHEWRTWIKENGEMIHYYRKKYHLT